VKVGQKLELLEICFNSNGFLIARPDMNTQCKYTPDTIHNYFLILPKPKSYKSGIRRKKGGICSSKVQHAWMDFLTFPIECVQSLSRKSQGFDIVWDILLQQTWKSSHTPSVITNTPFGVNTVASWAADYTCTQTWFWIKSSMYSTHTHTMWLLVYMKNQCMLLLFPNQTAQVKQMWFAKHWKESSTS